MFHVYKKNKNSVTSHDLYSFPCHKQSRLPRPLPWSVTDFVDDPYNRLVFRLSLSESLCLLIFTLFVNNQPFLSVSTLLFFCLYAVMVISLIQAVSSVCTTCRAYILSCL